MICLFVSKKLLCLFHEETARRRKGVHETTYATVDAIKRQCFTLPSATVVTHTCTRAHMPATFTYRQQTAVCWLLSSGNPHLPHTPSESCHLQKPRTAPKKMSAGNFLCLLWQVARGPILLPDVCVCGTTCRHAYLSICGHVGLSKSVLQLSVWDPVCVCVRVFYKRMRKKWRNTFSLQSLCQCRQHPSAPVTNAAYHRVSTSRAPSYGPPAATGLDARRGLNAATIFLRSTRFEFASCHLLAQRPTGLQEPRWHFP